jgi:hypothetical protein
LSINKHTHASSELPPAAPAETTNDNGTENGRQQALPRNSQLLCAILCRRWNNLSTSANLSAGLEKDGLFEGFFDPRPRFPCVRGFENAT